MNEHPMPPSNEPAKPASPLQTLAAAVILFAVLAIGAVYLHLSS